MVCVCVTYSTIRAIRMEIYWKINAIVKSMKRKLHNRKWQSDEQTSSFSSARQPMGGMSHITPS